MLTFFLGALLASAGAFLALFFVEDYPILAFFLIGPVGWCMLFVLFAHWLCLFPYGMFRHAIIPVAQERFDRVVKGGYYRKVTRITKRLYFCHAKKSCLWDKFYFVRIRKEENA